MNAQEIIEMIQKSPKKTPIKAYIKAKKELSFPNCTVFGNPDFYLVFGEQNDVEPVLTSHQKDIVDLIVECDRRNSAIPLLNVRHLNARIEPGAIIRDHVDIGENAVIMMGAILNVGAVVGAGTMIDMGAVLGGRAIVGKNCHIGAGTVLAGVVEPASAVPVIIEDDVLIGANAVVIEGCRIGKGSVVAAGSVVIHDVPSGVVVGGVPAKILKQKDDQTQSKTELIQVLRTL